MIFNRIKKVKEIKMKKIIKYLLLLSIVLVSCKESSNPVDLEVDYNYFYNSWKHSFEEQTTNDNIKIFRPSDYKDFQASWYRETLVFHPDNRCNYLFLAPNDAHYFLNGKWYSDDQEKNIVTIYDSTNTRYKKFHIIELKRDVLRFSVLY
jgi:hypothetical protein